MAFRATKGRGRLKHKNTRIAIKELRQDTRWGGEVVHDSGRSFCSQPSMQRASILSLSEGLRFHQQHRDVEVPQRDEGRNRLERQPDAQKHRRLLRDGDGRP